MNESHKEPEPIGRHKLVDAIPEEARVGNDPTTDAPTHGQPPQPSAAEMRQANREVNDGIESRDERLVGLGRAHQTTGRDATSNS